MLNPFIIPIHQKVCVFILALFLAACTVTPDPLTRQELSKQADSDQATMFPKKHKLTGNLSLQEAIARAVRFNLDHRAKAMEQALSLNQLKLDSYELLPTLVAKAGYSDRSKFSA